MLYPDVSHFLAYERQRELLATAATMGWQPPPRRPGRESLPLARHLPRLRLRATV